MRNLVWNPETFYYQVAGHIRCIVKNLQTLAIVQKRKLLLYVIASMLCSIHLTKQTIKQQNPSSRNNMFPAVQHVLIVTSHKLCHTHTNSYPPLLQEHVIPFSMVNYSFFFKFNLNNYRVHGVCISVGCTRSSPD